MEPAIGKVLDVSGAYKRITLKIRGIVASCISHHLEGDCVWLASLHWGNNVFHIGKTAPNHLTNDMEG